MGATAYGNGDRKTNPYYAALKPIFSLQPEGRIYINRDLANWPRDILHKPYTAELIRILGEPIALEDMWNPDAVLRVEDIQHKENTQERLDKAAATQMVFEDALMHVIDHFIRTTGSDRLVLTGGIGLNALGNMRLLEHFDQSFYRRELGHRRGCIYGCRRRRTMPASPWARPIWAPISPATASGRCASTRSIAARRRPSATFAPRLTPVPTSNGSS